jgi:hypothetical protein
MRRFTTETGIEFQTPLCLTLISKPLSYIEITFYDHIHNFIPSLDVNPFISFGSPSKSTLFLTQ